MKTNSRSVRVKLLVLMVTSLLLVVAGTITCVIWVTDQTFKERQADLEIQIRETLTEKGKALADGHAMALRPLVESNAFGDVEALIHRTVESDSDIIYGLYLSADEKPWAYISPTSPAQNAEAAAKPRDMDRWKELQIADLRAESRSATLFGRHVLEFSSPVVVEDQVLGTVRYGLGDGRLQASLETSRREAEEAKGRLVGAISLLGGLIILLGTVLASRAAAHLTAPLASLTRAAQEIAKGNRSHRVDVQSGDEIQVLAGAFNEMLDENEKQFIELEHTTEQALEASRMKSEFLANMSHEIRTPMNGVLGMTKLILKSPLDGKVRRFAETVESSANALMSIINDILDFSKMEAGRYTLQDVDFEPRTVLQEVCELLSSRALERDVELIYRVDPDVPRRVVGDPDRFRQVLNNLVGNAVKFTDHGEVFVNFTSHVKPESGELECRVEVIDTGVGIPASAVPTLFDAFTQVDGSRVRAQGGTGLGLGITKRLAEMMGGAIDVESEPGKGSKFTVTFAFRETDLSGPPPADWTDGRRVAVVEESARWASIIGELLGAWGLTVEVFSSTDAAWDGLSKAAQPFDAVLVGIQVKDGTAEDFIRQIRRAEHLKTLPIIALTQQGGSATLTEVEKEIAAQVAKPIRASDLFNTLQGAFFRGGRAHRRPSVDSIPPPRRPSLPVLVVDDNEINQVVAVEALEMEGYKTDVADNGLQAVEKVKAGNYLLVLMDCQMPVMDGCTATEKIRAWEKTVGKHVPIVALTAHALAGERERVLKAGMDDFLTKPFNPDSLRRVLQFHTSSKDTPELDELPSLRAPALSPVQETELTPHVRRSAKLIQLFIRNVPGQLELLRGAIEAGDEKATRAHAHKLKGSCVAIMAEPMAKAAETLQFESDVGNLTNAGTIMVELERRFLAVEKQLKKELLAVS